MIHSYSLCIDSTSSSAQIWNTPDIPWCIIAKAKTNTVFSLPELLTEPPQYLILAILNNRFQLTLSQVQLPTTTTSAWGQEHPCNLLQQSSENYSTAGSPLSISACQEAYTESRSFLKFSHPQTYTKWWGFHGIFLPTPQNQRGWRKENGQ